MKVLQLGLRLSIFITMFALFLPITSIPKAHAATTNVTLGSTFIEGGGDPAANGIRVAPSNTQAFMGTGSWQATGTTSVSTIAGTNDEKAGIYLIPGQFGLPASFELNDIKRVAWRTYNTVDTPNNPTFYLTVYLTTGGAFSFGRLTAEPIYALSPNNPNANQWVTWDTNAGTNQLKFHQSSAPGNTNIGWFGTGPTLADVTGGTVNWGSYPNSGSVQTHNYSVYPVNFMLIETGNPWDNGFTGFIDGIEVEIDTDNDNIADSITIIDLEAITPPDYLQFSTQPVNTQAGSTITPAVQVAYYDGVTGAIDTTFTGPITLAIGNNPAGGTLGGTLTVNAVAGVATFSDLSINNVGTGYTLVASAAAVTDVPSSAFDITAAPVVVVPPVVVPPVVETGSSDPAPAVAAAPTFADSAFLTKSVDKTIAQIGDTLTFVINYGNPKGNTLNNVVIADTFDSRLINIQVVSSSMGSPVVSGNSVTLQGFSLLPGQRATLTITAQISNAAKPGDVIGNTASLESPDASIHFSNVTLTTILPGALPATGASPLSALRLPALLMMALLVGFVMRRCSLSHSL